MLAPSTPLDPTPRQELTAAHYLAQGETVGMAARLAGIRPPALQQLLALVQECRRIEALPKVEQDARLGRFFRRAVERALADGRVGAIAAAMRLLGLASRGRGVPDGEGGWLTPDGRPAMPGRELDIVMGRDGPVRCLETMEYAGPSPELVESLEDQTLEQTQELNRAAYADAGLQWDPVTRTLWHWESARAEARRRREEAAERLGIAAWEVRAEPVPPAPAPPPTRPRPTLPRLSARSSGRTGRPMRVPWTGWSSGACAISSPAPPSRRRC